MLCACPTVYFQRPPGGGAAPELLLSASKYQHLPKDDDSNDEEGEVTIKAETGGAEGKSTEDKKSPSPNYVKLDFGEASGSDAKPSGSSDQKNYVKIDHSKQPPAVPPPPPPPAPPLITPQIAVQRASVPTRRKSCVFMYIYTQMWNSLCKWKYIRIYIVFV